MFFFTLFFAQTIVAQSLSTSKDTALFLGMITMPAAAPQFNLVFSANALKSDASAEPKPKISQTDIKSMEDSLEIHPHDIDLILRIADACLNKKDMRNYEVYLQFAFKNAKKAYESYPDSFEVVYDLINVLTKGGNQKGILQVFEQFVMNHPKHAEALSQYAIQLALNGQVEKAYHLVEQAQQIEPSLADIYLAAMICEVSKTMIQLSDIMSKGGSDEQMLESLNALEVDATFFENALAKGAPQSAQKALDASQLILVYYRTVIQAASGNLGKEKIKIKPIKKDLKLLSDIEKRAKSDLKRRQRILIFPIKY